MKRKILFSSHKERVFLMPVNEAQPISFDIQQNGWMRSVTEIKQSGERYMVIDVNQDHVPDFLIVEPKDESISASVFVLNDIGKKELLKAGEQNRNQFFNTLGKWRNPLKTNPNFHADFNSFGTLDKQHLQEMFTKGLHLSALVLCNASILPVEGKHKYISTGGAWAVEITTRLSQENDKIFYDLTAINPSADFAISIMNYGDLEASLCKEINEDKKRDRPLRESEPPVRMLKKPPRNERKRKLLAVWEPARSFPIG